ncbi:MAG: polyribonucleotide nucleotidyltransferase [Planctomycetota bacterium]
MASKKTARKKTTRKASATKKASTKKATSKKTPRTKKTAAKKSSGSARKSVATKPSGPVVVSREIGGRTLSLETGRMAKLADGAIVGRYGDTMVLATAQASSQDSDFGFFPLTVDYREKAAAAGKFPGGFFKREGRPTTREILTCRIIDRSIRPLFADGFKRETQVLIQVLSTDKETDSDTLAAISGFAALAISSIPNGKTLGACRIGLIDGKLRINPTWSELQSSENKLNLTVSAHEDAIVMVEAGAEQVKEDVMLEALELGHEVCTEVADMIEELVEKAGKEKIEFTPPTRDEDLFQDVEDEFFEAILEAVAGGGDKHTRGAAKNAIKAEVKEAFPAPKGANDAEIAAHKKEVSAAFDEMTKKAERESILRGTRADGRDWTTIRPISIEVGVLPRVHGSALFTRGETQALCTATLGTVDDKQFIDGIYPEDRKRWLLHYNFPPFSVGEVRRFGSPGRREIGHGALAERSLEPILPGQEEFAYSMRVTSEILESNGSSSMASVCGATLSLMDAGVPIQQPVAGIAMGLVVDGKRIAILSDILGSEDHCGDMDFKVAGSGKGITALQMDIKCEGLSRKTLEEALEQAREGRLHILQEMLSVIRKPRIEVSEHAPRLITIQVPPDKVGAVIGPGGRMIRSMQEDYECRIAVMDEGQIEICGSDAGKVNACVALIKSMTEDAEVGTEYTGKVTGVKEFGCFVEFLPGQEGLVHVSELAHGFIRSVTDVVQIGDDIQVKVIDIDDFGKVKLSRKALLPAEESEGDGGDDDRPRGRRRDRDDRSDDRPERRRERGRGRRDEEEVAEEDPFEAEFEDDNEADSEDEFEAEFDDGDSDDDSDGGDDDRRPRRERRRGRRDESDSSGPGRRRGGDREDRPRSRGDRDDRPRSRGDREDRPRSRGDREDRPRPPRGDRDDRPRSRGDRDDRPRSREDRDDRPRSREDRDDRPRSREDRDERPRSRDRSDRGGRDRDRDDRPQRRRPSDDGDRSEGRRRAPSRGEDLDSPRSSRSDEDGERRPRSGRRPRRSRD